VTIGLAQLLGVWSAGLTLLAAYAFPGDAQSLEDAMRTADAHMYRDKLGERLG
jgi:hypothetical protein